MAEVTLPALYDLSLYQGDDYQVGFVYAEVDDSGVSTITSADGWQARAQVREIHGGAIWLDLTPGSGLSLSVADNELVVSMLISDTMTEADIWSSRTDGVWDLEVISPQGLKTTIFAGRFFLKPDVTREVA